MVEEVEAGEEAALRKLLLPLEEEEVEEVEGALTTEDDCED